MSSSPFKGPDRTRAVVDAARELPREPVAGPVRALAAAGFVMFVGGMVWAILRAPSVVVGQWSATGEVNSTMSKGRFLASLPVLPGLLTLVLVGLLPLVVLRAPGLVNVPHRDWWFAAPRRVVRLQRNLRGLGLCIVGSTFAMFGILAVAVAEFSRLGDGQLVGLAFAGIIVASIGLLCGGVVVGILPLLTRPAELDDASTR